MQISTRVVITRPSLIAGATQVHDDGATVVPDAVRGPLVQTSTVYGMILTSTCCRATVSRTQVHARGSLFASPDALLKEVTGNGMRPKALVEHLRSKYSEIYGL